MENLCRIQTTLFLLLVKQCATEVYGKVEKSLRVILDGSEKSAARSCHCHTQKEHQVSN
jgi:hypothetical protein